MIAQTEEVKSTVAEFAQLIGEKKPLYQKMLDTVLELYYLDTENIVSSP